jgi:hypothetical protein
MQNDDIPVPSVWVMVGTRVEVELIGAGGDVEPMAFDIVPDAQADLAAGFLGAGTPLAMALHGHRVGDKVAYDQADFREVQILSIAQSERRPDPSAAAAREAAAREAVRKSDLADAVRLALTVNVKWGDYDPEGIAPDDE